MALFGYPLAHENDAERAARAALSIQRALADLNRKNAGARKPELVARIGLETGPAVVDAGGEIYGDVTNVAARGPRKSVTAASVSRIPRSMALPRCRRPRKVSVQLVSVAQWPSASRYEQIERDL